MENNNAYTLSAREIAEERKFNGLILFILITVLCISEEEIYMNRGLIRDVILPACL